MGRFLVPLVLTGLASITGMAAADKASLDCPLRQIGLDYAASLQPFRSAAAFEEVADALNGAIEAANCSVRPKAALASAGDSRVAWAPLPRAGSGVASVFADPTTKGSDTTGDGSKTKPFRTIQRALKAVSSARAWLGGRGGGAAPHAVVLRAGTFHLGATIHLDSATGSHVSFQAYPGELVSISGGGAPSRTPSGSRSRRRRARPTRPSRAAWRRSSTPRRRELTAPARRRACAVRILRRNLHHGLVARDVSERLLVGADAMPTWVGFVSTHAILRGSPLAEEGSAGLPLHYLRDQMLPEAPTT